MRATSKFRLWFASILLTICVALVLVVTMTPSPIDISFRDDMQRILEELQTRGMPRFVNYRFVEFASNVGMFVPIGFLATLLFSARWWWVALFVGPCFSAIIELSQNAFLPERFATVSDLIANSLGGLIGVMIAVLFRAVIAWRDRILIDQTRQEQSW